MRFTQFFHFSLLAFCCLDTGFNVTLTSLFAFVTAHKSHCIVYLDMNSKCWGPKTPCKAFRHWPSLFQNSIILIRSCACP